MNVLNIIAERAIVSNCNVYFGANDLNHCFALVRMSKKGDNMKTMMIYSKFKCHKWSDFSFRSNVEIYYYLCFRFDCWRYTCV